MFRRLIRYCYPAKKWFVFNGARWQPDTGGVMARAAKQTVETLREIAGQIEAGKDGNHYRLWAQQSQSLSQQQAMLTQAQSEPGISIQPDAFDQDSWLLGCPNGTLELRTRTFRPSRPDDYISKVCGIDYDPAATCPNWDAFLQRIFPSEDVRRYVQKVMGVALTGDTSDQCFYVLHGLGANGKTTLVETVAAMLGDYAVDTPTDTLLSRTRTGSVPNDLARLKGARFVYAAEPDVSKGLAEELLKRITGGEPITARFLFREFFTCWPEFKLFLLANHMPQIAARDYATWRRVRLVPFTETIPEAERDKHFRETRLMPELAGILNWALDGLEMTQADGLVAPAEVHAATAAYRDETDELADFFADCVETAPGTDLPKTELYARYQWWMAPAPAPTRVEFNRLVKERGIQDGRTRAARVWRGIRLKQVTA